MTEPNTVTVTFDNPVIGNCSNCGKELREFDEKIGTKIQNLDGGFNPVGEPHEEEWYCVECLK